MLLLSRQSRNKIFCTSLPIFWLTQPKAASNNIYYYKLGDKSIELYFTV